ncbi:Crp/Fnr family transcriptional regulator [Listeria rustica]|uniref:Crp/Fnr family transcriptional regulator n=1 Tax=Listeria rustica TaxID=2713503 RepID=A0A7W1T4Y6_9LIST|nr:Crp/Fnr family transcriptional regulator [Listeria rustica]MBA3925597.1 Crp/Fnr family transcriptional regulator [Listeria rustica]
MNLYQDRRLFADVLNMIDDLNKNKVSAKAVQEIQLEKNEILDLNQVKESMFVILSGVIQTECDNGNIVDFSSEGELLFAEPIQNDKQEEWIPSYKTITKSRLVKIDKEYFLNFASIKPSYMELILKMTTIKLMYVFNDSRKYNLTVEERFDFSLAELGQCLGVKEDEDRYVLPTYINKHKIASFSKTSRKYTAQRLSVLESEGNINVEKNKIQLHALNF